MNFDPEIKNYLEPYLFDLPESRIARRPAKNRDDSLLLYINRTTGEIQDLHFRDLPSLLFSGDLLVRNITAVSRRRVYLYRQTGGRHEVLFLEQTSEDDPSLWKCLIRGRSRLKPGETLGVDPVQTGPILKKEVPSGPIPQFQYLGPVAEGPESILGAVRADHPSEKIWHNPGESEAFFDAYGTLPIPPYMNRESDEMDQIRYQTVYASTPGSVAAPTAGLHFTPEIFEQLLQKEISVMDLELKVGYGTFAPLEEANFIEKRLHRETYRIPEKTADELTSRKSLHHEGGRLISIGTTTLRALEDCYRKNDGRFLPGHYSTELFLHPPEQTCSIDGLITNFHLPGSSLLLLVASFLGKEYTIRAYQHAIQNNYRFYSYGDAMLIL